MKAASLPVGADQDDLFATHTYRCADCGEAFDSPRVATHCAMCSALRIGQVGPAIVQCLACGKETKIPVLSPVKLCGPCRLDPTLTLASLRTELEAAEQALDEATTRLDADVAHADEADRARYWAALERKATWDDARWHRAVVAALAKGDGLSPLLRSYEAYQAADAVWERVTKAIDEVERYRDDTT